MVVMRLLLAILMLISAVGASGFVLTNFEPSVSVGGIYNIDAYAASGLNDSIPCIAYFKDPFNNTARSFTTDPNFNMIQVNPNGFVRSFVGVDDSFLVGQNYTFWLSCGNYTAFQEVFMDVSGDLATNRLASNISINYFNHPEQYFWQVVFWAVGLFVMVAVLSAAYSEIKHR
jgi:hypothetical protein